MTHPIALLNTSILTADGLFRREEISVWKARRLVDCAKLDSAIGHEATAKILTTLLGVSVEMNRQRFTQQVGQEAIVFQLNGRPPEGAILTEEEIEKIGYSFKLLTRIE